MQNIEKSHLIKLNKRLKSILPPKAVVAVEISELLQVSKEGAYRRLRGETSFTLEELLVLRRKLGISIDELTSGTENVSFMFKPLYEKPLELNNYLGDVKTRFKKLASVKNSITYNVCEDLPFFRQFGYESLASFKLFYWKHSILIDPDFSTLQFSLDVMSPDIMNLTKDIYKLYSQISSTEIWTQRTMLNTVNQLEYFFDCGLFETDEDLMMVYKDLICLIEDIVQDARISKKSSDDTQLGGDFNLHICELSLDNNSIFLETDEPKYLATGFNSFNSLHTMDKRLLREYRHWLSAMISKSTNISGQAERIRHDFYKTNRSLIIKSATERLSKNLLDKMMSFA